MPRLATTRIRYDYTEAEGLYFVGPRARGGFTFHDEAGNPRLVRVGEPVPEAFGFRANRRRVMLQRDELRFIPHGPLPEDLLLGLIAGLGPDARAAIEKQAGSTKDADILAHLRNVSILELAKHPAITTRRQKPAPLRPGPDRQAAPKPDLSTRPLTRAEWGNDFEAAVKAADGELLEAGIIANRLNPHFVNAMKQAEKSAKAAIKTIVDARDSYESPEAYEAAIDSARPSIVGVARDVLLHPEQYEMISAPRGE